MTLVVVGDALLDRDLEGAVRRLSPDAPVPVVDDPEERARPGGAALAAVLASTDGRAVRLVTALADDAPGRELQALLDAYGVEVVDLGLEGPTPEKVRVRAAGRSLLRLDRGGPPGPVGPPPPEADTVLTEGGAAILVSDYGRGVADQVRRALRRAAGATPLVWDPHPRGREPVPGARLATPNRDEAARFAPEVSGNDLGAVSLRARALSGRWRAAGVVVTLGDRGALYVEGDGLPMIVPARRVPVGDPCGAGDRFAASAAGILADGGLPSEAVTGAVASAAEFVAAGGASSLAVGPASPERRSEETLVAAVRARGGTVVATSGCFDLLHAGHVATLESARALGDCLIVCLNSDRSIRRLKGPGRPVVGIEDRAAVLRSLACVDEVVVFDEDTPEAVLSRLRPDVFAKGGDYAMADLPEARLLETWGGQAVILPYVAGRSTTGLMEEVVRRGGS